MLCIFSCRIFVLTDTNFVFVITFLKRMISMHLPMVTNWSYDCLYIYVRKLETTLGCHPDECLMAVCSVEFDKLEKSCAACI